jgi:hypothetical protein
MQHLGYSAAFTACQAGGACFFFSLLRLHP